MNKTINNLVKYIAYKKRWLKDGDIQPDQLTIDSWKQTIINIYGGTLEQALLTALDNTIK